MESSAPPSTSASRRIAMPAAPSGPRRGRCSRRLRRLLERRRFEPFQHLAYGERALGELAGHALDAEPGRADELPAVFLDQLQHGGRVEGRMRHELQLD